MSGSKKTIQLRMSAALYTEARHMVEQIEEASFNEFAIDAIREKMRRVEELRIDEAFGRMGRDEKYLRTTADVSGEFATSDRETLKMSQER